jgi:hypothetical protein
VESRTLKRRPSFQVDDPALLTALGWSLPLSTLLSFLALLEFWDEGGVRAFAIALLVFAGCMAAVAGGAFALAHLAAGGAARLLLPSGRSSPGTDDFSLQKALLARGRVAEALHSIEGLLVQKPRDPGACLFAADVFAGDAADPRRAEQLFHRARALPSITAEQDLYATNRLVDLYLGPLQHPARASAELARLMERHPRSAAAAHAARIRKELDAGD